jgi:hypothetical protein
MKLNFIVKTKKIEKLEKSILTKKKYFLLFFYILLSHN